MLPVMGAALLARDASHSLMHLAAAKLGKHSQIQIQIQIISTFYHSTMFADIGGEIKSSNMKIEV